MSAPTAAVCTQVARALDAIPTGLLPWPELRVALVASFTIDPVAPVLKALGAESGVLIRTHTVGGDHWPQELLDPASGLRQSQPQVVVIALELEDLSVGLAQDYLDLGAADVDDEVTRVGTRVGEVLASIRAWTDAKVLLHDFPAPLERSLGIIDASHARGRTLALRRLRQQVRQHASAAGNVFVVDLAHLVASIGHSRWRDARLWTLARIPYSGEAMLSLAREYMRYLRAFAGRTRKVLVLDLDETLWGGIVGEDGPEGIHLGVGYKGQAFVRLQRALRQLTRRGVLLAINSKNNADDALEIIERHPAMLLRREDFAAVRINWQDKATNLVEIADELGLGLDSFVFVDDSAAECERVRQALPEVLTVHLGGDPATYASTISDLGVFDALTFGEEDRVRTAMYRSEAQRRELQQSMASLDDFYRSLAMTLEIEPVTPSTLARAAELTQRTNQFNLTTRRFTQDELRNHLAAPGHDGFVFRLRDRFGDHGIIGLALTERDGTTLLIETLLLSCRVLKRTVEDSVLAFLTDHARAQGADTVEGWFKPSRKNTLAAALFETHGFEHVGDREDGTRRFRRSAAEPLQGSPWVTCLLTEDRHA
jgi:FkbH-like protein